LVLKLTEKIGKRTKAPALTVALFLLWYPFIVIALVKLVDPEADVFPGIWSWFILGILLFVMWYGNKFNEKWEQTKEKEKISWRQSNEKLDYENSV
jgi:uncharacterized RDD family membrane protein YckC